MDYYENYKILETFFCIQIYFKANIVFFCLFLPRFFKNGVILHGNNGDILHDETCFFWFTTNCVLEHWNWGKIKWITRAWKSNWQSLVMTIENNLTAVHHQFESSSPDEELSILENMFGKHSLDVVGRIIFSWQYIVSRQQSEARINAIQRSMESWKWPAKSDVMEYEWDHVMDHTNSLTLITKNWCLFSVRILTIG